jgi:two-component system response regulator QseB
MRILIVEDDSRIAAPVAHQLRGQKHVVDVCYDGRSGLEFAATGVYDLVLLDVMLPGLDGLSICRRLRGLRSTAMIMMMTARDATEDKVSALDAGADDYVVKPFDLAELSARVRALSRRGVEVRDTVMRHGMLELDSRSSRARYAGKPLALTPTEYAILEALMRSPSQVFTRTMLLDKVASFERGSGNESIKTHVANLRRKIRGAGCPFDPISTVYGSGYCLADA